MAPSEFGTGPLYFRFAAKYRRCGVYLVVGYLLLVATNILLQHLDLARHSYQALEMALIFAGPMLGFALLVFRQLLRVDERGVWRRRFLRWDLWPWEAFAGGEVRQGESQSCWVYPSKPWWNRVLALEFLEEKDREYLVGQIHRRWRPPPRPALPEELVVLWWLRRWARLTWAGIYTGKGRRDAGTFHPWSAMLQVRIIRLDHARRDCLGVECTLRQGTGPVALPHGLADLALPHEGWRRLWHGADPELVAAFFERAVPADRLLVFAKKGTPRTLAEVDWRLGDLARIRRHCRIIIGLCGTIAHGLIPVWLVVFVILRLGAAKPWPWDLSRGLGTAAVCILASLYLAIFWYVGIAVRKALRSRYAELTSWRTQLLKKQGESPSWPALTAPETDAPSRAAPGQAAADRPV